MKPLKRIGLITLLSSILIVFMGATTPEDLPLGLLLVPFAVLAAIIFHLLRLLMDIFRVWQGNPGRQRGAALLFAIVLTNFAVLQSIGRLSVQDVILALAITLIVTVYVAKFQIT